MTDNSQYSPEEISRVQSRIDEIGNQILAGGDFAARYRKDPAGTLRSQGLPDDAVAGLFAQAKSGGEEVSGYMAPLWTWNGHHPSPFDPGPFDPFGDRQVEM
jgi:hypothetical protein